MAHAGKQPSERPFRRLVPGARDGREDPGWDSSSWDMLYIEAQFINLVQPAVKKPVDVPFGAEPRDCLVVRAKRKVGSDAGRARGFAAQKEVAKYPQGIDDCQQLEDVTWMRLLCRREFATFVGGWVVMAVVVRLRQDRRDGLLTSIRREDGALTRAKGA